MLFPARHGFPYVGRMSGMSGAPDFMGHHAGRMEGMGRMRPVGGARHAGRLFPLVAGFPGVLPGFRPPCWGGCGGMGQAGASILKRHTFEIARHHVGQVGHVGHPTNKSKAHQRFSLPDMAFPMSGACRACRARPTSWGIMRDGWKGMGRMRPVGGMGRRTPHRAALVGLRWGEGSG